MGFLALGDICFDRSIGTTYFRVSIENIFWTTINTTTFRNDSSTTSFHTIGIGIKASGCVESMVIVTV